jgi:DNA-binding response OmpR family regulator
MHSVLLVEPDRDLAWLMRLALRREGFRVATAADSHETAVWAAAQGPLVAVVDTDQVSLRAAVGAIEAGAGPRPLVLLTGPREPTFGARGRCHVAARLRKPFGVADLVGAVRDALADVQSA